jgi:phenylacetate-CoA ligase
MESWQKLSYARPAQIRAIQNNRLKYFFRHLLPFHPHYRAVLQQNKLKFTQFSTTEDLSKLPFSSKLDLLPTEDNAAKSRDFILQPNEKLIRKYSPSSKVVGLLLKKIAGEDVKAELEREFKPIHIHFTTGRSTMQIPFLYSYQDLEALGDTANRIFETIGASKDDVLINAFPFAPHLAFWLGYYASRNIGLLSLPTGGGKVMGTQRIIESVEKLKGTILLIMPGYGYHLLRDAVEQKKDFSSLKFVLLGGERVNPGLRKKYKEFLSQLGAKNIKILSTYAFTEAKTAWVQCHEESGYHLYPDLEHIELVDSDGKSVKEGEMGEVVYTALDWRGSTVVRYRTGDFCKGLQTSVPCKYCGRTVPQLHYDIERKSENVELNLTKVKGELINLNTFHIVMHNIPEIDEWQVEIKKKNNDQFELDELYVHIALKKNADKEKTLNELKSLIQTEIEINPVIEVHSLEEMVEMLGLNSELKEKRILDRRKEIVKS